MSVSKVFPSNPIIYGGAAVAPDAGGSNHTYNDPSRVITVGGTGIGFYQEVAGRYLADHWVKHDGYPVASGDSNTAVHADAVVVFAADGPGRHHTIQGVSWSYDTSPTGGTIAIESPSGVPLFGPLPVTAAGPGFFPFPKGFKAPENQDLIVRLKDGGAGVTGAIAVQGQRIE